MRKRELIANLILPACSVIAIIVAMVVNVFRGVEHEPTYRRRDFYNLSSRIKGELVGRHIVDNHPGRTVVILKSAEYKRSGLGYSANQGSEKNFVLGVSESLEGHKGAVKVLALAATTVYDETYESDFEPIRKDIEDAPDGTIFVFSEFVHLDAFFDMVVALRKGKETILSMDQYFSVGDYVEELHAKYPTTIFLVHKIAVYSAEPTEDRKTIEAFFEIVDLNLEPQVNTNQH